MSQPFQGLLQPFWYFWYVYLVPHFAHNPEIYGFLISFGTGLIVAATLGAYKPQRLPAVVVFLLGWLLGSAAFGYDRYLSATYRYPLYAAGFILLGALGYNALTSMGGVKGKWPLYLAAIFVFLMFVWPALPYFLWQLDNDPRGSWVLQFGILGAVIFGATKLFKKSGGASHGKKEGH